MTDDPIHLDLAGRPTPVSRFVSPRERPEIYPGTRPSWSYLFTGEWVVPFDPSREPERLADRTAVLTVGSNGCPRRLADPDKFGGIRDLAIPVVRGWVEGIVSVYVARRSTYGSVPASAAECPGARSRLWATLLTDAEVERMAKSEGGDYALVDLRGRSLLTEEGVEIAPLMAYRLARVLTDPTTGDPIRLRAFETVGCDWPALGQREAWNRLDPDPAANDGG